MTDTRYFVEKMDIRKIHGKQVVYVIFKRIPTKEKVEELKQMKKKMKQNVESTGDSFGFSMFSVFRSDNEPELNFDSIRFKLSLRDVNKLGLTIGKMVLLNIPENAEDVIIPQITEPVVEGVPDE